MATEVALALVDREASVMPFPFQDTIGDQTAGEMVQLSPLRAGLTAIPPELIHAHTADFLALCAPPIELADLRGRQGQAIRRIVLGAVSDDQDLEPTAQPTRLRPIGVAPTGPERLAIEPAVLREATTKYQPESRMRRRKAFEGYQASNSTDARRQCRRVRA
jgi:hypothetical protein